MYAGFLRGLYLNIPASTGPVATDRCKNGHEPTPDELTKRGECKLCRAEDNRRRAAERAARGDRRYRVARLSEREVRKLRAMVGCCVECGWTPEHFSAHTCKEK